MRHVVLASDLGGDLPKESTLYETFDFNIEDKSRYGALDTIVDSCLLISVWIFRNWTIPENSLSELENYKFLYELFIVHF